MQPPAMDAGSSTCPVTSMASTLSSPKSLMTTPIRAPGVRSVVEQTRLAGAEMARQADDRDRLHTCPSCLTAPDILAGNAGRGSDRGWQHLMLMIFNKP